MLWNKRVVYRLNCLIYQDHSHFLLNAMCSTIHCKYNLVSLCFAHSRYGWGSSIHIRRTIYQSNVPTFSLSSYILQKQKKKGLKLMTTWIIWGKQYGHLKVGEHNMGNTKAGRSLYWVMEVGRTIGSEYNAQNIVCVTPRKYLSRTLVY